MRTSATGLRAPAVVAAAMLAVAVAVPSTTSADRSTPAAHAAAKKKKKKPLTATVSGTFTVRQDDVGGFGNDEGPSWQQLKVFMQNAEIPFRAGEKRSASAEVPVRFEYTAEAHTMDRGYALGCDREDRVTTGMWLGMAVVTVRETKYHVKDGKSRSYGGWQVVPSPPEKGIATTTKGSYQEWASILMSECLTFPVDEPLGRWGTGFARPDGLGKLTDDNRSIPLTSITTEVGQTGTVKGSVKFNKSVAP